MRLIVFLTISVLLSCNKKNRVPEDIIPVRDMTNIMWDLIVADELVAYRYSSDLIKRMDSATALYTQVTSLHGTTQAQLKKSFRFYEGRPDLLQVIFDTLNQRATRPFPLKKDSIRAQ